MTEHLFKLANAFQAAKNPDGSSTNVRQLVHNLSDFSKQMEEAITQGTADEAHIRQRAVLAALISRPNVREEVEEHPALAPLLKTVPVLQDCALSMLVRPLNCQSAVFPVLAHLPLNLLSNLMKMELQQITKAVPPPLLSFVVELSKALLHVLRSSEYCDEVEEILELFVPVFRIAMQNLDSNVPKNAAFTFLLLLELLYQFSRFLLSDNTQDEILVSHVPELENSFCKRDQVKNKNINKSVIQTTVALLKVCHESVHKIDVDTWMSWAEIEPTNVVYCSKVSCADPQSQLTIQSIITYRAFSFLTLLNTENESCSELEETKKELDAILAQHSELHGFLKQIASDPNYDPDCELEFAEVVNLLQSLISEKEISNSYLQNEDQPLAYSQKRLQKLIKQLLQKSKPNQLFSCSNAASVICCLAESMSEQAASQLLQHFLKYVSSNKTTPSWMEAVLAVCKPLPGTVLRDAVLLELRRASGEGYCKDWLATADYFPHITSLCNTMANNQENSNHSLLTDGGLWWVAVQRPRSTVATLVQQAVSVSGMSLVAAQSVRELASLCTTRYANCKLSVLSEALQPFLTDVRSFSKPKHRIAFVEFFSSVCEGHHSMSQGRQEEDAVLVEEVLRELLVPTLQWQGPTDLDTLEVPLAVMQVLLQQREVEVVRCCRPGADTASLVLSLLSIMHNCQCLLSAPSVNNTDPPVNEEVEQPAYNNNLDTGDSANDEFSSPSKLDQECSNLSLTEELELSNSASSASTAPAAEVSSAQGFSQCLELLCRSRDVLKRLVREISRTENHRQSILLLRRYFNSNSPSLSISCAGLLQPLFDDPIQSNSSDLNSSEAATDASPICTPMHEVCNSRAVTVMRLMNDVSTSGTCDNSEAEETAALLQEARDWPYEQMIIVLVQVLNSAPQEDWIQASNVLERMNYKVPQVSGAPVHTLVVLRDVLLLMSRATEAGLPVNASLCYRHYTAAATQVVKQRCDLASWREQLSLVTRVFLWWCTDHVAAKEADLSHLLLLRLANMLKEVAALMSTSSNSHNKPSNTNAEKSKHKTSNKRNWKKSDRGGTEMFSDEHSCEDTELSEHGVAQNNIVNGVNQLPGNKFQSSVPLIEFRAMVGSLVEPFLKRSRDGTLSQTIATRLVTLLQ